jgi:hypothetical protein
MKRIIAAIALLSGVPIAAAPPSRPTAPPARAVAEKTALYDFDYAYPAAAIGTPDSRAMAAMMRFMDFPSRHPGLSRAKIDAT